MQGGKKVLVKLGQLDRTFVILRQLVQEKLPFKASYWLRRDIDVVGRVYQPFVEAKQGLFKQYAETDLAGNIKMAEDGLSVKLIDEKKEDFWKEYAELANKEVEVEIYPLELEWFEKVEITVEEIVAIGFLIEEEMEALGV
jgi:hypothetical protein